MVLRCRGCGAVIEDGEARFRADEEPEPDEEPKDEEPEDEEPEDKGEKETPLLPWLDPDWLED